MIKFTYIDPQSGKAVETNVTPAVLDIVIGAFTGAGIEVSMVKDANDFLPKEMIVRYQQAENDLARQFVRPLICEIYYDNRLSINPHITMKTESVFDTVALAKMLGVPIKPWQFNPPAVNERIRDFAKREGVKVLDD